MQTRLFGVQISGIDNKDRELKILATDVQISEGTLIFRNSNHQIITAFSNQFWKAIWVIGKDGNPVDWNPDLTSINQNIKNKSTQNHKNHQEYQEHNDQKQHHQHQQIDLNPVFNVENQSNKIDDGKNIDESNLNITNTDKSNNSVNSEKSKKSYNSDKLDNSKQFNKILFGDEELNHNDSNFEYAGPSEDDIFLTQYLNNETANSSNLDNQINTSAPKQSSNQINQEISPVVEDKKIQNNSFSNIEDFNQHISSENLPFLVDQIPSDPLTMVLEALDIYPYLSLEQFSADSSISVELLEKTILSALTSRAIAHGRVADNDVQRALDIYLPELVKEYKPKKPAQILELLKNKEETQDADAIQLKVWMLRNPKRKVN